MIDVFVSGDGTLDDSRHILGVVEFGDLTRSPNLDSGYPVAGVAMREQRQRITREVWVSSSEVSSGSRGGISYSHDGGHLFGILRLGGCDRYRAPTRSAYRQIMALIGDLGYPSLVRMWNYIAGINDLNADRLEVYRDFCQGRAEGFEDAGMDMESGLPAATGIGSGGDGVVICFLAEASNTCVHFENSRQVPAHRYPTTYGPRSPSFARATLLPASAKLFLSGTASILGHRSTDVGHLDGQCNTTLENIRVLLSDISYRSGGVVDMDSFCLVKAYVRHADDVPRVQARLREAFGEQTPIEIFNADICRSELLLEVEGVLNVKLPERRDRF